MTEFTSDGAPISIASTPPNVCTDPPNVHTDRPHVSEMLPGEEARELKTLFLYSILYLTRNPFNKKTQISLTVDGTGISVPLTEVIAGLQLISEQYDAIFLNSDLRVEIGGEKKSLLSSAYAEILNFDNQQPPNGNDQRSYLIHNARMIWSQINDYPLKDIIKDKRDVKTKIDELKKYGIACMAQAAFDMHKNPEVENLLKGFKIPQRSYEGLDMTELTEIVQDIIKQSQKPH